MSIATCAISTSLSAPKEVRSVISTVLTPTSKSVRARSTGAHRASHVPAIPAVLRVGTTRLSTRVGSVEVCRPDRNHPAPRLPRGYTRPSATAADDASQVLVLRRSVRRIGAGPRIAALPSHGSPNPRRLDAPLAPRLFAAGATGAAITPWERHTDLAHWHSQPHHA